jgi:NAD(P)-dependent dehydrogenase (short-subunit alcohol dehydrogenase family)
LAYKASPKLIPYSATKAAIQNFTASLAQLWGEKGIRVNCVAPGPIWTPLIPSTMPVEQVKEFGADAPLKARWTTCRISSGFRFTSFSGIQLYDRLNSAGNRRIPYNIKVSSFIRTLN